MTQEFYAKNILPSHIEHIKHLQSKYKCKMYFQEDNDGSHGTRSLDNLPLRVKRDADLKLLVHPAQSPDLNPIESVWEIIKQRLRGGRWQTLAEFKEAIQREWRKVTQAQIRRL